MIIIVGLLIVYNFLIIVYLWNNENRWNVQQKLNKMVLKELKELFDKKK